VPLGIEGRNKIISMARRALGKFPRAGKSQQDTIQVNQLSESLHGAIRMLHPNHQPRIGAGDVDACQAATR